MTCLPVNCAGIEHGDITRVLTALQQRVAACIAGVGVDSHDVGIRLLVTISELKVAGEVEVA